MPLVVADQVRALFYSQYGESYHHQFLFDRDLLPRLTATGEMKVVVLTLGDKVDSPVIGVGAITKSSINEGLISRCLVAHQYRGARLGSEILATLVSYGREKLLLKEIHLNAVTSHTGMQKSALRLGFKPYAIFGECYTDYFQKGVRESSLRMVLSFEDYVPKKFALTMKINRANLHDMGSVFFSLDCNANINSFLREVEIMAPLKFIGVECYKPSNNLLMALAKLNFNYAGTLRDKIYLQKSRNTKAAIAPLEMLSLEGERLKEAIAKF